MKTSQRKETKLVFLQFVTLQGDSTPGVIRHHRKIMLEP